MDVLDLVAKLKLDSSEYNSGLSKAQSQASTAGSGISSAFTKAGSGITSLANSAGTLDGKMGALKSQFDASAKKVDKYGHAVPKY